MGCSQGLSPAAHPQLQAPLPFCLPRMQSFAWSMSHAVAVRLLRLPSQLLLSPPATSSASSSFSPTATSHTYILPCPLARFFTFTFFPSTPQGFSLVATPLCFPLTRHTSSRLRCRRVSHLLPYPPYLPCWPQQDHCDQLPPLRPSSPPRRYSLPTRVPSSWPIAFSAPANPCYKNLPSYHSLTQPSLS